MITDRTTIERIQDHAASIYPEECCGFLIGPWNDGGPATVVGAEPVENVRGELRERRYRISPDDLRTAEVGAEALGHDVIGFYHSHPDHPARPSDTDLEEATFPGYAYVIISVNEGEPGDITAWSLKDDRSGFDEQTIFIKTNQLVSS
jgi:proteasome lid subunit RPN8/RPN11